jgi:translation initiation factor IF-2
MTATGDKIRIYDLARDKVPEELDEKTKKKVQAELTRQILAIAPEFGQSPKTASSSIDLSVVEPIMSRIDLSDILGDTAPVKKSATVARRVSPSAEGQEASKEEAQKPRLKIVRRITVSEQEDEAKAEAEAEEAKNKPEEAIVEEEPELEVSEEEVAEEKRKEEAQKLKDDLQDIMKPKRTQAPREVVAMKDLSSVRSIPLRPTSSPQMADGQPYRVARPTISSQGIGRKKKRGQADERPKPQRRQREEVVDHGPREITITKPMTVRELSQSIEIPETQIITFFFMKKIIKTVNDVLEKDLIIQYLESQNFIVNTEAQDEGHTELKSALKQDESEGNLIQRPPVVTIMGHVDHGKTTLVDTIRKTKSKIVDSESGGITQHISTYRIEAEDFDGNTRKITILDTPGHEAFTAMRKRGASVTDIIVLIVAADDGVMPQTIECINHIKENNIPFLVCVNKIDKPGANPDKVLGQLAEYEIITQDYGGTVECAKVSALNNTNIDDLLMKIMLVADAELADKIQSNPNRLAIGTVIEAELSRSKGPVATVLIQNGTLHRGDFIAAGAVSGRVKSLVDETGTSVDSAEPSTAVQVLGLSGTPKAGDAFQAYKTIKEAKKVAEDLAEQKLEEKRFRGIYSFASEIKEGQLKELRIMIKADVQGSAEAIAHEINKLSTGEVLVKPISVESGSVTSNDVNTAASTGAVIVGFHVGVDTAATAKLAEKLGVTIKSYEIIYKLTEDLERAVLGLHQPDLVEEKLGEIEIRKIFTIDGRSIAGSYVTNGKIVKGQIAKVLREGAKIYEGKVDYLRRFKDDAKEVREGFECGLSFEKYNDLQEGDKIECWTVREVARTKL